MRLPSASSMLLAEGSFMGTNPHAQLAAAVAARPLATPSAYQSAVFTHVERSTGHAVVVATAGSGKTTTLVEVARRLPPGRACFLAFNRATAAELRARLPSSVHATTIHALGRDALVRHHPAVAQAQPEEGKYRRLAAGLTAALPAQLPPAAHEQITDYLARLAGFARLELTDARDPAALLALLSRYGLEPPVAPAVLPLVNALVAPLLAAGAADAEAGHVDYTDMVYLPVVKALPLEEFTFVCVDEAQDLSSVTLALVLALVRAGARALFVGDPRQAIYAFAGADRLSLDRIVAATGAVRLPLSVSYRCPTRHVLLARRFAPEMEPATGAKAGLVRFAPEAELARSARPGDLVMSRVNAPLVATALALAAVGTPTAVLGEDLATGVLELARRVFGGAALLPRAAASRAVEHGRAEARRLEFEFMTHPQLAELLSRSADLHLALQLVLESAGRQPGSPLGELLGGRRVAYPEFEAATARLLAPGELTGAVVLSSIHKAKGREATRVFLLRPEELGVGQAQPDDEAVEANVLFVALTRAKQELVLLERHRGAVAKRLAANARAGAARPAGGLERRWDEVLKLARLMARER